MTLCARSMACAALAVALVAGLATEAYSAFTPSLGNDRVFVRFIDEP